MCNSDAGDIDFFIDFTVESNSFGAVEQSDSFDFANRPDTIFLCAGDFFKVSFDESTIDLSGDANPSTQAGVALGVFSCTPGDINTYDELLADPCVIDNGEPPFDEFAIFPPDDYFGRDYDVLVSNLNTAVEGGSVPSLFPDGSGMPTPVVLTLVPMTIDSLNPDRDAIAEGGPNNCTKLSIDNAFQVAYLQPVNAPTIAVRTTEPCTGAFDIRGGAPQLRGGSGYRISIVNVDDNTITGQVLTDPNDIVHDAEVTYRVPQPGQYRITIEDDFSCAFVSDPINHGSCQVTPTFDLGCASGPPGSTACFDVTATSFSNVAGFQLTLTYDASIIDFSNFTVSASEVANSFNLVESDDTLRATFNPIDNASLGDGEVLFTLCFDADPSIMTTVESPIEVLTPREIVIEDTPNNFRPVEDDEFVVTSCPFRVITADVNAFVDPVSEQCFDDETGSLRVAASGGTGGPYFVTVTNTFDGTELRDTINGFRDTIVFVNLAAITPNVYDVVVSDGTSSATRDGIMIPVGPRLNVNVVPVQELTCAGDTDGILSATVRVNGTDISDPIAEGYTFAWRRAGSSDVISQQPRIELLGDGDYVVDVVSPTGCERQSNPYSLGGSQITVTEANDQPATCSGASDGSITINATGGTSATGEYVFFWSDGEVRIAAGSDFRDDLMPAIYTVVVQDDNGCQDSIQSTIMASKTLVLNIPTPDVLSCFGDTDGSISGNVPDALGSGYEAGDFPLTLTLTENGATVGTPRSITNAGEQFSFDNLPAGDYALILQDNSAASCELIDSVSIFQPEPLALANPQTTAETCDPSNDGTFSIDVTGGTGGYTYELRRDGPMGTPVAPAPAQNNIIGLSEGAYFLLISDANGCTIDTTFAIAGPVRPTITSVDTAFVTCIGDANAQLRVDYDNNGVPLEGIGWYRVNPDGSRGDRVAGSPSDPNAEQTQDNLGAGGYRAILFGAGNCLDSLDGAVLEPEPLAIAIDTIIPPNCPGERFAAASFRGLGGAPASSYRFRLTSEDPNGAFVTNPVFSNLGAGDYLVEMIGGLGCETASFSFTIQDPPALVGNVVTEPVSCPDDVTTNGRAVISAGFDNGDPAGDFLYRWTQNGNDLAGTGPVIDNLVRGEVTVVIIDNLTGCESAPIVDTVRSPEDFAVTPAITPVTCFGDEDGSIVLTVTGGREDQPYDFDWNTGATTDAIDQLGGGTFTVAITDANGCAVPTNGFTVPEPSPIEIGFLNQSTKLILDCADDLDGSIGVFRAAGGNDLGGTPYSWSSNTPASAINDNEATQLPPGTYSVTLTDSKGCEADTSATIEAPEPIEFGILPIIPPLCENTETQVFLNADVTRGGTVDGPEGYTFDVNRNGFRIPIGQAGATFPGEVVVTVFDQNDCFVRDTFGPVPEPPAIVIDLPEEIVIELGDTTTQLDPIITPAGDVYAYQWTNGQFLSSDTIANPIVFPTESEDFLLTVVNSNGCVKQAEIFVEVDANRNVYIPNAFSPNRDGLNDDFRVFACTGVQSVDLVRVFDRWGGQVFEAENLDPVCRNGIQLWDGLGQNSERVNPGVYVYMVQVTFLDGITLLYRGDITVVR